MVIHPGARIGVYEVTARIGAGGMGEVYRARDTKLGREVALKVLPEAFAGDPERVARFQREAKVLASLNHPHIAAIYGLEETESGPAASEGVTALVLELVEGPTLADRIAQGPISVDETLPIASQIAEALEAAHEQGVVHRDLKPANIKFTADGTVKVLDFGLAKALIGDVAAGDVSQSPTISLAATQAGLILGTAAYMAPEQAKGRPVDKRADIWAFGCVVYEMLTGRRVFAEDDLSDTLASVLKSDVDWQALPAETPPYIRRLLRRCLEKDPRDRLRDIGEARIVVRRPLEELHEAASGAVPAWAAPRLGWGRLVAGVLLAALVGLVVGAALGPSRPAERRVARFVVTTPNAPAAISSVYLDLAISPGGTRVAYTAGSPPQLHVRDIDALDGRGLRGTDGAANPFFSPDGTWIAYWAYGSLRKISIRGGPPVTLCAAPGLRGGSWGSNDTIVFATLSEGLFTVSAGGGEPVPLLRSDEGTAPGDSWWPEVLPGGRAVLFSGDPPEMAVTVLDLETLEARVLVARGSNPRYSATGHLLYGVDGTILAVPFDPGRLRIIGAPTPVVDGVMTKPNGATNFDVGQDGTLVYMRGGPGGEARTVVWVDRDGRETPLPGIPSGEYRDVRVSPDGTRVAVATQDDIWTYDVARATLTRLTTDPAYDNSPLWSPDGTEIVFTSTRRGPHELFSSRADGTGAAEPILTGARTLVDLRASAWSPDGAHLLFTEVTPQIQCGVGHVAIGTGSEPRMLVQNEFCHDYGAVSPDGRWMAYNSLVSDELEIYVERYPELGDRQQISTGGGVIPLWSGDGDELFFSTPSGRRMLRAAVQPGPPLVAGRPEVLFEGTYLPQQTGYRSSLDKVDTST